MLIRTSILLLVAACFAVAAQPDLPPAEVAPAPQTAELPLPDTPHVVAADPPRRRRAATDRDDGDAFAPGPGPSLAETPLNCSSIEGVTGNMPGVDLFYELAKFSGLESLVVPGGVFHEVTGDISVFAPEDDALLREISYFAKVFNATVDQVRADKPLLQEILRQFIAYGDVSRDSGFLGLFVTLDGSVWNWTDANPNDDKSEIALVPVGLQLDEPPVFFEVDDGAGTRVGCSRGRRLSRVVRDDMRWRSAQRRADRRYAKAHYGVP